MIDDEEINQSLTIESELWMIKSTTSIAAIVFHYNLYYKSNVE